MSTEVDDFLAHYGVSGMKWGKRKALRGLDKAEKAKMRAKQEKDVTKARTKLKSGEAKAEYKAAKAQYKADRQVIGKVAAKKAFNKVKAKNMDTINKANEFKNGKEVAAVVALSVGAVAISALLNSR